MTLTPKISTYITTFNALFFQSTLEQTIRQALAFSDEIIISNSSNTSDGTSQILDTLKSEYPDIIKLYPYKEPDTPDQTTLADRRTFALKHCTGDYCILQDDDEQIHEKYASYIRQLPIISPTTIAFRFNTIHFYRSFTKYHPYTNDWYKRKIYMVKNLPTIKHGRNNTDPDNFVIQRRNSPQYEPLDLYQPPTLLNTPVTVFHYGWSRNDAVLLYKKYLQEINWHGSDYWNNHKFPFSLEDPNNFPVYIDSHPQTMIPIINKELKYNSRTINPIVI